MCYTEKEYQQRKHNTTNMLGCMLGNILKTDTVGVLDCIIKQRPKGLVKSYYSLNKDISFFNLI